MEIAANEEGEKRRKEEAYDGISDSHSSLSNDQQGSQQSRKSCRSVSTYWCPPEADIVSVRAITIVAV